MAAALTFPEDLRRRWGEKGVSCLVMRLDQE